MQLLLFGQVEALPHNARHLKRIMKLLAVNLLHPSRNIVIEPMKSAVLCGPTKSANCHQPGIVKIESMKEFQPTGAMEGGHSSVRHSHGIDEGDGGGLVDFDYDSGGCDKGGDDDGGGGCDDGGSDKGGGDDGDGACEDDGSGGDDGRTSWVDAAGATSPHQGMSCVIKALNKWRKGGWRMNIYIIICTSC